MKKGIYPCVIFISFLLLLNPTAVFSNGDSSTTSGSKQLYKNEYYDMIPFEDGFRLNNPAQLFSGYIQGSTYSLQYSDEDQLLQTVITLKHISRTLSNEDPGELLCIENADNAVLYHYRNVSIEYKNNLQGLRQNIYIYKKPSGSGLLQVHFNYNGDLIYRDENGPEKKSGISLSDIRIWDSKGDRINFTFRKTANEFILNIADSGATYPLTIDPLASTFAWKVNTLYDNFGYNISSGDFNGDGWDDIAVASQGEEKVMVFYNKTGVMSSLPKWKMYKIGASNFGLSIAGNGDFNSDGYDDLAITCNCDNGTTYLNEGGMVVYFGSATGLSYISNWAVYGSQSNMYMGTSVDYAGDVNNDGKDDLIVGSVNYKLAGSSIDRGNVKIFYGASGTPDTIADWSLNGITTQKYLGWHVSNAGNVNGDDYDDFLVSYSISGPASFSASDGGVKLFYGGNPPDYTADWVLPGSASDRIGIYTDGGGDMNNDGYDDIIIGADAYNSALYDAAGKAMAFYGSASGLSAVPDWTFTGTEEDEHFGREVHDVGDINVDSYDDVIVTAYDEDYGNHPNEFYLFLGDEDGLQDAPAYKSKWDLAKSAAGNIDINHDGFGDIFFGTGTDDGSVYAYLGGNFAMQSFFSEKLAHYNIGYYGFGYQFDRKGDYNNDGYYDLLMGHPKAGPAATSVIDDGKAFLFKGVAGGINATTFYSYTDAATSDNLGKTVSYAGDVNNDGYDDMLIACSKCGADGKVFFKYGSASLSNLDPDITLNAPDPGSSFGSGLSDAGDVNHDGYDDFIIGAYNYDIAGVNYGAVHLYLGSAAGISATPSQTLAGFQDDSYFGNFVNNAGDVNGDGYDDILVGAQNFDGLFTNEGAAYVYYGNSTGLNSIPAITYLGESTNAYCGQFACGNGDLNNDGFDDIAIGQPEYTGGFTAQGKLSVYFGSSSGTSATAGWTRTGNTVYDNIGWYAAMDGDFNHDDYDDLSFGTPAESYGGVVYPDPVKVFYGKASGLEDSAGFSFNESDEQYYGYCMGYTDINMDGKDDLSIGVPNLTNNFGLLYSFNGFQSQCGDIEGVVASVIDDHNIIVSLTDNPSYHEIALRYRVSGSGSWQYIFTDGVASIAIGSLTACTAYEFQIQPVCMYGSGSWSDIDMFTTECSIPCDVAPVALYADMISSTSATLHWSSDEDAISYRLQYKKAADAGYTTITVPSNSYTLSALTPGYIYQFKVRSNCSGSVYSPYSALKYFTTPLRDGISGQINIYPNPTTGLLNIELPAEIDMRSVQVVNMQGSIVYQSSFNSNNKQVDLRGVSKGIYMIQFLNAQDQVFEQSMIVLE